MEDPWIFHILLSGIGTLLLMFTGAELFFPKNPEVFAYCSVVLLIVSLVIIRMFLYNKNKLMKKLDTSHKSCVNCKFFKPCKENNPNECTNAEKAVFLKEFSFSEFLQEKI